MIDQKQDARISIGVDTARTRITPKNDFASQLQRGAGRVIGAVTSGISAATANLPGVGFVSAVANAVGALGAAAAGSGGSGNSLLDAQQRLQEQSFNNSLQLLELQRRMNRESQQFTAISNVEKVRHDMAKTAINNIR